MALFCGMHWSLKSQFKSQPAHASQCVIPRDREHVTGSTTKQLPFYGTSSPEHLEHRALHNLKAQVGMTRQLLPCMMQQLWDQPEAYLCSD